MPLRLASYNIQYGTGQDGRYDLGRIAAAVTGVDILCLQEVTTNWPVCKNEDQPAVLAEKLGLYASYASAYEADASTRDDGGRIVNRRRTFGNMVLARWPILYSRSHSLPRPFGEVPAAFHPRVDFPRCALEAVVAVPEGPIRVFSIHLSHLPGGQREAQVEALRALLRGLPGEAPLWDGQDKRLEPWTGGRSAPPVPAASVLMGDFNFRPEDPEYGQILAENGAATLADAWVAAGLPRDGHPTCAELDGTLITLDYAFMTADLAGRVTGARVAQSIKASDHFPVFFDLAD